MTADGVTAVLAGLDSVRDWQEELYRDLHAHPELSHQERRTASRVAARLQETGCEVHDGVGGTGVVGVLRNGDGPTVLLRADMDALPVREATGLPYASTVTAIDADGAEVPVMHACGHDVHVASASPTHRRACPALRRRPPRRAGTRRRRCRARRRWPRRAQRQPPAGRPRVRRDRRRASPKPRHRRHRSR
jgi:hypothetical protein